MFLTFQALKLLLLPQNNGTKKIWYVVLEAPKITGGEKNTKNVTLDHLQTSLSTFFVGTLFFESSS